MFMKWNMNSSHSMHLKNLTSAFTVEAGLSKATEKYLRARFGNLKEREKIVDYFLAPPHW